MKKITKHYKRLRYKRLKVALLVIMLNIIFIPSFCKYEADDANYFLVYLNGEEVGYLGSVDKVEDILSEARRIIGRDSESIVYVNSDVTYDSTSVVYAEVDSEEEVLDRMVEVLKKNLGETLVHAYTLRIGDYSFNLADADSVKEVLQAALDLYEDNDEYIAQLISDPDRELNALTVAVVDTDTASEELEEEPVYKAGFDAFMDASLDEIEINSESQDFDDYTYGILDMQFEDNIEVVDCYLTADQITSPQAAIDSVVTIQEKKTLYEVVEGDTLGEIAIKTSVPMDKIIELNETLENENSMIRIGDELVVTTSEPPIVVERVEQEYIEEIYDADIEYIENDDWYTTEKVTLQQPSAGRRNIVAKISYKNDKEIAREIVKEEVLLEAVPKIIERGTKIPPTYIKPISGGRMSSGFGGRKAPTKGASTNHKGIDWAVPVGSAVYASSGGTVTKAGWGSGYGNVVYIKHPDGKETRYGHLSKVLVSPGQSVKQGQKIALSGNTGRSTGPHLHFEIRIGSTAVNPLKYLN